jgi:hypothetical protein
MTLHQRWHLPIAGSAAERRNTLQMARDLLARRPIAFAPPSGMILN